MNELSLENIQCSLIDIGYNEKQINSFMKYYKNHDYIHMIQLLRLQRYDLLAQIHQEQKKIDRVDYLIFILKKENV